MNRACEVLCQVLDEHNMKYDAIKAENGDCVVLRFSSKSFNNLPLQFDFIENESTSVSMKSFSVCVINEQKLSKMLSVVNELNNKYRYLTFAVEYDEVDENYRVCVSVDFVVIESFEKQLLETYIYLFNAIIENAYPIIMAGAYSDQDLG